MKVLNHIAGAALLGPVPTLVETSDDPQVVLLIRQHARAVSEFVEQGMARMHEPTPLPEGYKS